MRRRIRIKNGRMRHRVIAFFTLNGGLARQQTRDGKPRARVTVSQKPTGDMTKMKRNKRVPKNLLGIRLWEDYAVCIVDDHSESIKRDVMAQSWLVGSRCCACVGRHGGYASCRRTIDFIKEEEVLDEYRKDEVQNKRPRPLYIAFGRIKMLRKTKKMEIHSYKRLQTVPWPVCQGMIREW